MPPTSKYNLHNIESCGGYMWISEAQCSSFAITILWDELELFSI